MHMQQRPLTDLVDNKRVTGWAMDEALKTLLAPSQQPILSIATTYFNLDALKRWEPEIHKIAYLRLLVGKGQEQAFGLTEKLFQEVQRFITCRRSTYI